MNKEEEAAKYGITRQAHAKRLKTWIPVVIDGEKHLVNPKQIMKLIED